ncbi:MAG: Mrp/NBP35 family ATP-binding protein [Nitrospinota bacterium]|nr:Mrp/NBP35 family ATP-binding protein [Nitrospinota bacterium]MEC9018575.1 Mrp/NBP35 family ATP-binding protein [Nitrospinota bacterium]MEC9423096.1 Mrp/NBP35 family ATP-binding protein [Nitrospinota bacterium]MED5354031.1 Mrp/NBP35 family ATP-binding protein [Nitrospinota bacterium]
MVVTGECRLLHTCEMCEFNNETDCKADKNEHNRWLVNKRMNEIKHKLIVGSNKGGVGKSTVTTNLAIALQESGYSVGLADADLHGPNIPKLLQAENVRLKSTDVGIDPYETSNGLKVASLGFLIEDPNMHIAWRDAVKYDFIIELLGNINWGPLDYLLFDLPPGTGNEQITIIDFIGEVDGAVVVTTPQDLAILDARKMISFSRDSNVPIVGVIENMSTMSCPHCEKDIDVFKKGGGQKLAEELVLPYLGSIPLDGNIVANSDSGQPVVLSRPDSVASKAFMTLAENCHKFLNPEEAFKK